MFDIATYDFGMDSPEGNDHVREVLEDQLEFGFWLQGLETPTVKQCRDLASFCVRIVDHEEYPEVIDGTEWFLQDFLADMAGVRRFSQMGSNPND